MHIHVCIHCVLFVAFLFALDTMLIEFGEHLYCIVGINLTYLVLVIKPHITLYHQIAL